MLQANAPCDPAIHETAIKMARDFVWIIQAILMEHERPAALQEAYRVAREGLENYAASTHAKPSMKQEV